MFQFISVLHYLVLVLVKE